MGNGIPKYRLHKPTGQAVVRVAGRDFYLGKHGTKDSRIKYAQLIADWQTTGEMPEIRSRETVVADLILSYWQHAETYYVTDELAGVKVALRWLRKFNGTTEISKFGPLALRAIRDAMIEEELSRSYINSLVSRIVRAFRWGTANELVTIGVYQSLTTLDGLRKGKSKAVETHDVLPVDDATVDATLKVLRNPVIADMIRLQRATGMRPGELFVMRPCDIDRRGDVWIYKPPQHKNQHRGLSRAIFIGPIGQQVLGKYLLNREPDQLCFVRRNDDPFKRWNYSGPIAQACKTHDIPHWHPHQLRHSAATRIREEFGIEAASSTLGHANLKTTEIYAEKSARQAADVARRIG